MVGDIATRRRRHCRRMGEGGASGDSEGTDDSPACMADRVGGVIVPCDQSHPATPARDACLVSVVPTDGARFEGS